MNCKRPQDFNNCANSRMQEVQYKQVFHNLGLLKYIDFIALEHNISPVVP